MLKPFKFYSVLTVAASLAASAIARSNADVDRDLAILEAEVRNTLTGLPSKASKEDLTILSTNFNNLQARINASGTGLDSKASSITVTAL